VVPFTHSRPVPFTATGTLPLRRGVAQLGSAPALGAGGPRFESGRPDQLNPGSRYRMVLSEFLLAWNAMGSEFSHRT
jgi:hypothetical protein